tara:strand:+ start:1627 stop:1737 length:111 start_codon:yes stop_codon:yes gene_type:complete
MTEEEYAEEAYAKEHDRLLKMQEARKKKDQPLNSEE